MFVALGFHEGLVTGQIGQQTARTIFPTWFDHLAERFSQKEVQFIISLITCEKQLPSGRKCLL